MKKIYNLVKDYFDSLEGKKVILLDFDATMVIECWPYVGQILPGCIDVAKLTSLVFGEFDGFRIRFHG